MWKYIRNQTEMRGPIMDRPLVSIVTPSFNQGAYIEQTILSVRQQSYQHIEHIIVDGGSTDDTLDVIRRHEGTYDMRWISEPDGGMYEAINKGLRMARGEVLAYLNTDDRYFPWTVKVAVRALAENPDVGFVFGDVLQVEDESDAGKLLLYPPFWLGHIRRFGFLGQPTVFWRRAVFEEYGGFDESLQFVADCEYWMRIGERYRARKLDEMLAIVRDHPEAKRFAQMEALSKELNEVRPRYVRREGLAYRMLILVDRAYAFLSYRYYLLRFLHAYFRRHRLPGQGDGAWAAFFNRNKSVQVFVGAALARFLPFTGGRFEGRFEQDLVRVRRSLIGRHKGQQNEHELS